MKGKNRRAELRERVQLQRASLAHETRREAVTQTGRFFVSFAQGDPERAASLIALAIGTGLRVGGSLLETGDSLGERVAGRELKIAGAAFWGLAAVNEAGNAVESVASAMFGRTKPPVGYDVTGVPQSSSISVSNAGGSPSFLGAGLPFGAGLLGGGLLAGGAAAPAAAAAAGGAGAFLANAALATGIVGTAYAADQWAGPALQAVVDKVAEIAGKGGTMQEAIAGAAAQLSQRGLDPNAALALAGQLVPVIGRLPVIGQAPQPVGVVDGQPYYTAEAYQAALRQYNVQRYHGGGR